MSGHSRFFNRELSWIEFNARVLHEALRPRLPLLERLKFLSIVTSNFDEFYMVRVASVKRQIRLGDHVTCPSGMAPSAVLAAITARVRELVTRKYECLIHDVLPGLEEHGIRLLRTERWSAGQSKQLKKLFQEEIFPVLTPVRARFGSELPYVTNLRIHAAFVLSRTNGTDPLVPESENGEHLAIVQIPASLDRIVSLPDAPGVVSFALLEDVVVEHAHALFPGYEIREHCLFRVTRDADLGVDEERDEDFVEAMEQIIERRDYSRAVRLSVNTAGGRLKSILARGLGLSESEVFERAQPLDVGCFMALTTLPGFDHLRYDRWVPAEPPDMPPDEPVWDSIRRKDVVLHHPFESFEPVVRLLRDAADDPGVLAIKLTLYRTSGDSPIVRALERAARNGKQVMVLVEIKARFDEEQNISWAQTLERAGAIVIYGIARLKVHAKALMIVRRERKGVRRYVHLSTGNYNDTTARLYTDLSLLSTRDDLAYEVGLFFNAITGYAAIPVLNRLIMAPVALKSRLIQLIERETSKSSRETPGRILAKLNSLADPDIIEALYRASAAGVQIRLNVRGICMLVPGVQGVSEKITVVSIIDRYLEHARALYFHNGGLPEVYISSADWMPRNLDRRVELMIPVEDDDARARILQVLHTSFEDNTQSHELLPTGFYRPIAPARPADAIESQRHFHELALSRAEQSAGGAPKSFSVRRGPA